METDKKPEVQPLEGVGDIARELSKISRETGIRVAIREIAREASNHDGDTRDVLMSIIHKLEAVIGGASV